MSIVAKLGVATCLSASMVRASPCLDAKELPYIRTLLPQNQKEFEEFQQDYQTTFSNLLQAYINYLNWDHNPTAAIKSWEKASSLTQVKRTQCWLVTDLYKNENPALVHIAEQTSQSICDTFNQAILKSPTVLEATLTLIESKTPLSPDQAYFFARFLENFQKQLGENKRTMVAFEHLQSLPQTPFTTIVHEDNPPPESLSILNGNVLFMPNSYTYYFGGVSIWQKRLDKISALLQTYNPSILCLQEVHDETSATALYKALQDRYAYFYVNIGSRIDIIDPTQLKMNSGLFVASQYPLENPRFTPFDVPKMQAGINKGFFEAIVRIDGQPRFRLITTHLNPGEDDTDHFVLEQELQAIAKTSSPFPTLLVGDLNIFWNSSEYEKSSLKSGFYDPYNEGRKTVSAASATCTEYFNGLVRTTLEKRASLKQDQGQICDYAVWMGSQPKDLKMTTKRVDFYDLDYPTRALSDHQGLMNRFDFN